MGDALTSLRVGGGLLGRRIPLKTNAAVLGGGWIQHSGCGRTGSTGDQETGLCSLRQPKHVERAHEGSLDGMDGIELIMRWRSRAREMVNL